MKEHTFYDILEISPNASSEIIKSAYKALSKKYHPDIYKGDYKEANRRMAMINEAYKILSNPERRKEYDASLWDVCEGTDENGEDVITDIPFPNTDEHVNSTLRRDDSRNTGCLRTFLRIIFWLVIVILVIRSCSNNNFVDNNLQNSTQTQQSTIATNQKGWARTQIYRGKQTVFSISLPEELSTHISNEEKGVLAEYFTDNWGIYLITQIIEMDELTNQDWTQIQIDNSYDGTAAEFMFSLAIEEYYNTCILPSFSQIETKPKVEYSKKEINGILWNVATYTEENAENNEFDLTMTLYFHADNYAVTTFILSNTCSSNDITEIEKNVINEWVSNISNSLMIQRISKGDNNQMPPAISETIGELPSIPTNIQENVMEDYVGSWYAPYYQNKIWVELWKDNDTYWISVDASTESRVLCATAPIVMNSSTTATCVSNDGWYSLDAEIVVENGTFIISFCIEELQSQYSIELISQSFCRVVK